MGEETKTVYGQEESEAAATVSSAEKKQGNEKAIIQFSLQDS